MLKVWPNSNLQIDVGCYPNDPDTLAACIRAAQGDARLRIVIHDREGPSTKADCLNRLYRALCDDEERGGERARMVVFHDAEDMVDPAALCVLDDAIADAGFVQLPVLPVPHSDSRWLGSHYCDEFAEAHAKTMVVRDHIGASLPSAGVGCAVARDALEKLARGKPTQLPFAQDSLTEDYEMGLSFAGLGERSRFLRYRHSNGDLVATRAYFPSRLQDVVRQKTRWIHGIAFQGWDRLGWKQSHKGFRLYEFWMRYRDRRSPFSALAMMAGYLLLFLGAVGLAANLMDIELGLQLSGGLLFLLFFNGFTLIWRGICRFVFTFREYGLKEAIWALMRFPVANVVAIMAGSRAFFAYIRNLSGRSLRWDKTPHFKHPLGERSAEFER